MSVKVGLVLSQEAVQACNKYEIILLNDIMYLRLVGTNGQKF